VNLGHVLRKKRHYREAEQHYLTALSFAPGEAGTLAALAFTCLLQVGTCGSLWQSSHDQRMTRRSAWLVRVAAAERIAAPDRAW